MSQEDADAMDALVAEAEKGYCTEHLGGGKYCLTPAVAEIDITKVGRTHGGLKCAQHVKGWPLSVITWLDDNAELRERAARSDQIRREAVREIAEDL